MPNSKSAKKRLRQNVVRRDRNKAVKSALRSQLRKVREAVQAGDVSKAETEMQAATKRLDRAGQKNVIHKNTAARTKSRLQKLIKTAKTSA
ncbi:MAG: 30S ribosomal protein S20 [Planctomycetaceae bacterium]|nr:30S ribosomal protein S20 [Planctomycetales bacterium]MCB9924677.1 30S ribosomal protein S20 [Planctomycetaceae bacterium]